MDRSMIDAVSGKARVKKTLQKAWDLISNTEFRVI
jgi:carbon monoxide dehydrogenase subunit G